MAKQKQLEKLMGAVDQMVDAAKQAESARDALMKDARRRNKRVRNKYNFSAADKILNLSKHAIKELARELGFKKKQLSYTQLLSIVLLNDSLRLGWPPANVLVVAERVAEMTEQEVRRSIVIINLNDGDKRAEVDLQKLSGKLDKAIDAFRKGGQNG